MRILLLLLPYVILKEGFIRTSGNPGLGKSEVAAALVQVLRGVTAFAKRMEEPGDAAALELQALRDPARTDDLAEAKRLREERREQERKDEARRRKLSNGRSATTEEETAIKTDAERGSLIKAGPRFTFGETIFTVVTNVDHSDNTVKVTGTTQPGSQDNSWQSVQHFTTSGDKDSPLSLTDFGCVLRCRTTTTDNSAGLCEGALAISRGPGSSSGTINVYYLSDMDDPKNVNEWSSLRVAHFEPITQQELSAVRGLRRGPNGISFGSIVVRDGAESVVWKYDRSDNTVKVVLRKHTTQIATVPLAVLSLLPARSTPDSLAQGATVRVKPGLPAVPRDRTCPLAPGSRGVVTAVHSNDGPRVVDVFVQRSPNSAFEHMSNLPAAIFEVLGEETFVTSLLAQPSSDADTPEYQCVQGHAMIEQPSTGSRCDVCCAASVQYHCEACGEVRCASCTSNRKNVFHTGCAAGWPSGVGTVISVKGGLLTVVRQPGEQPSLEPLGNDSWISFGKLRMPTDAELKSSLAHPRLSRGCLVRSTFTGNDRGAPLIKGAVGIVVSEGSDNSVVNVYIQRHPNTRNFTDWTLGVNHLEVISPAVYEEGLLALADAAAPSKLAVGVKVRANKSTNDRGADLIKGSVGVILADRDDAWQVDMERTPGGPTTTWTLSAHNLDIIGAAEGDEKGNLKFHIATGSQLLLKGPKAFQELLDDMAKEESAGGVLFLDEAYQLNPSKERDGAQIINLMMDAMERHRRKLTVIVAGYEDQIDELMGHNPGMRGRFGHEVKFRDYTEGELHEFIYMFVETRSHNTFGIAAGHEEAAAIIARRLARGANQKHFANARLVRNMVDAALQRAKSRLFVLPVAQRRLELTWSDLLGVCPLSELKHNYEPIVQLERMVGFPQIKRQLLDVLTQIVDLQVAELQGERIVEVKLNQRIYGNPGTGKTTLARIYARVLCDLGLTVKKDIYETTPNRLKGDAVGEAEKLVRAMMEAAREKVLFLDEAYELYDDSPYSKAMMDALVSEIADTPAFRPIIVVAGYKDRMEEMLTNANPGLYRRLAPNPALTFEGDFCDADLVLIVSEKIAESWDTAWRAGDAGGCGARSEASWAAATAALVREWRRCAQPGDRSGCVDACAARADAAEDGLWAAAGVGRRGLRRWAAAGVVPAGEGSVRACAEPRRCAAASLCVAVLWPPRDRAAAARKAAAEDDDGAWRDRVSVIQGGPQLCARGAVCWTVDAEAARRTEGAAWRVAAHYACGQPAEQQLWR